MSYTTDWKPTKAENPDFKCNRCQSDAVEYREWESSDGAHEDFHYRCNGCGRSWWVEGADA
jgi:transposase-like protein